MKASGQLVVHAAPSHLLESRREYLPKPRVARAGVLIDQQIEHRRMREFRRAAESAILLVEHFKRGVDDFLDYFGRKFASLSGEGFGVCDCAFNQLRLFDNVAVLLAIRL